jgi:hypothetical protein
VSFPADVQTECKSTALGEFAVNKLSEVPLPCAALRATGRHRIKQSKTHAPTSGCEFGQRLLFKVEEGREGKRATKMFIHKVTCECRYFRFERRPPQARVEGERRRAEKVKGSG